MRAGRFSGTADSDEAGGNTTILAVFTLPIGVANPDLSQFLPSRGVRKQQGARIEVPMTNPTEWVERSNIHERCVT